MDIYNDIQSYHQPDYNVAPTGIDELYCLYGTKVRTISQLIYTSHDLKDYALPDEILYEDGDGTVNERSLQGSSHSSQAMKFSIPDACDKIKEEISSLQQQYHSLKMDYEKVVQEKNEMQRHNAMYYEITAGLNLEMHRQSELAKRLVAILGNVMPFLGQEHQTQVAAAIERAKQVSVSDLSSIMSVSDSFCGGQVSIQNSDEKFPKMPNGAFGFPSENMDLYKMMASSGMMPPLPGMPSSANMPKQNPVSSNGPSMMGSGTTTTSSSHSASSAANFLSQNPAALAQMMASFSGGQMDKDQRTAAAVAMAALAAAGGMPPTNQPPFPPGLNPSQQQLFASMASAAAGQMDSAQIASLIAAMGGPRPPDEKRRKMDQPEDLKQEEISVDDSTRMPFKSRRSPSGGVGENGDNKADLSFSIGQNRSRTSTPNHLLSVDGPATPKRKPPQASTPNSRPTSRNSPQVDYPPRNVSNPGCGAQLLNQESNSRGHSPALSSCSAPSSSAFKPSLKINSECTPNGSSSTPPFASKPSSNGLPNGLVSFSSQPQQTRFHLN
ncbi:Transducin-like enhancer protein 4 [Cichlidogyrus casuarinus]|uniref:Transducin-like enhancer protein 4 n=1 Tax=Cichlidogyrus casuarinus TaxID=1844966 RepID=A0ABD2PYT9_9PLAT